MKLHNLAHQWVDAANSRYREQRRALVTHAPAPYRVIGRPKPGGRVTVQLLRGPVDYVGHDSHGRGFRFDLKSSHASASLNLGRDHLPDHQRRELLWCVRENVPAGLLVCRYTRPLTRPKAWYWIPARWLVEQMGDGEAAPAGDRWGSVRWADLEQHRIPSLDAAGFLPDYLTAALTG